jgi:hypothetical protein
MKRPLRNKRIIGPFIEMGQYNDEQDDSSDETTLTQDKIGEYKSSIKQSTGVKITDKDAVAVDKLSSPMLQSYVMNVMGRLIEINDDVSVQSVINSDPVKEYSKKLGAEQHLDEAQDVY